MPDEPWESLLLAWLHDPVDKAADIEGRKARARRYAAIVMGREVTEDEIAGLPYQMAHEQLPLPSSKDDIPLVCPDRQGDLLVLHPLSAESRMLRITLDPTTTEEKLRTLVDEKMTMERRFLTLWRLAPDRFPDTPADTRCPDHTLWQHLDTMAAITWASHGGRESVALLSFKLSPVQPFIEASRSLRDLLSGSYLLSWLCFAAIEPVLKACGPTALVYPALRRIPLMDWWLEKHGVAVRPDEAKLARASLPNRFLAIVPRTHAADLAMEVRNAARRAWLAAASDVHRQLQRKYDVEFPRWDELWNQQIDSYFDFRCTWLTLDGPSSAGLLGNDVTEETEEVAKPADPSVASSARPGQWQSAVELSAALMKATGQIRHIPEYVVSGDVPQKCTLFGTYEQMGPARLSDSRKFWEKESIEKEDADRRCAVALVKKHAFFAHFRRMVGFDLEDIRFPDTKSIAGDKNCYYAALTMDGDDMGSWLSGEKSPSIRQILHPDIVAHFEKDPVARNGLDARNSVSPSLHAAISQALTHFAVDLAPEIVERHEGKLIYSGGDDLLAALPLTSVLQCARDLRDAFRAPETMGCKGGISAGLAVAHYKEDLRYVLHSARNAEKGAKRDGKDRLTLAILRRSGEHAFVTCPWDYLPTLQRQMENFAGGASDRWAYQLRRQLRVLEAIAPAAFRLELNRIIRHSETPNLQFIADFDEFESFHSRGDAAEQFVMLCQSASFLARCGEER